MEPILLIFLPDIVILPTLNELFWTFECSVILFARSELFISLDEFIASLEMFVLLSDAF